MIRTLAQLAMIATLVAALVWVGLTVAATAWLAGADCLKPAASLVFGQSLPEAPVSECHSEVQCKIQTLL